jgi:hypothetical protein
LSTELQLKANCRKKENWIPAFAGMTLFPRQYIPYCHSRESGNPVNNRPAYNAGRLGNALKGHFSRGTTVPIFTVFMDPSPIEDSAICGEARIFMKTINAFNWGYVDNQNNIYSVYLSKFF